MAFGLACAAARYRPRGWQYLHAVPYCLVLFLALLFTTIVLAIEMGAPK